MTRDEFAEISWASFLSWAIKKPEMIAAFELDTGVVMPKAASNPIEAMIDKATGYVADKTAVEQFVEWATINHFGLDEAPVKYREHLAKKGQPK